MGSSRTRIYTRTGDKGETGLLGGIRVPKDDSRVEAYGSIDELNSVLGIAKSFTDNGEVKDIITKIQKDLFTIGAELASPRGTSGGISVPRIKEEDISKLERFIDGMEERLTPLKKFILPEGTPSGSLLHFARSVARRAERRLVTLSRNQEVSDKLIPYVNRLSDLLFVMARTVNLRSNYKENFWESGP